MSFSHFLITRFNIPRRGASEPKGIDPNWLSNRFDLFESYCLPSVVGQLNLNFNWLVFFDYRTPEPFKKKVEGYKNLYPFFIPIYLDEDEPFKLKLKTVIKEAIESVNTHVITSRLDNDDALHEEYIEQVQNILGKQDQLYLDLRAGYSLQIQPDIKMARIDKVMNPFASVIERLDNFVTILDRDHDHWGNYPKKAVYKEKALWIQIIHESNLLNQFGYKGHLVSKGFLVSKISQKLQFFNINIREYNTIALQKRWGYNFQVAYYHLKNKIKSELKLFIKSIPIWVKIG